MINFTNAARDSDDFEFDNLNPYKMKKYPLVNEDQKENLTATIQKKENIINNSVLLNQGKILLTGLAMKKYGWLFYQPILLVLKDNKQLIYYDPETNKLKVLKFSFKIFA